MRRFSASGVIEFKQLYECFLVWVHVWVIALCVCVRVIFLQDANGVWWEIGSPATELDIRGNPQ